MKAAIQFFYILDFRYSIYYFENGMIIINPFE